MPNPTDTLGAVTAAAERLEDLLDDGNHVAMIELYPVVPVPVPAAGAAPGQDGLREIAQAVYDAVPGGCRLALPVRPYEQADAWRDILRHDVTEGYMQPARRFGSAVPPLRTPEEIRRTGEAADGLADLIEAHLGPVRSCGPVPGPYPKVIWWRRLLLVSDRRATILYLGIDH
ncbi:hypothetical protein ATKI12_8600 [Kitasatospora sp. Ki12]